jgi:hypothetical protein
MGKFQAFLNELPLRWGMKCFPEIPVEGGYTPACEIAKLFQRHIKHEILFHKLSKVYFTRL